MRNPYILRSPALVINSASLKVLQFQIIFSTPRNKLHFPHKATLDRLKAVFSMSQSIHTKAAITLMACFCVHAFACINALFLRFPVQIDMSPGSQIAGHFSTSEMKRSNPSRLHSLVGNLLAS